MGSLHTATRGRPCPPRPSAAKYIYEWGLKAQDAKFTYLFYLRNKLRSIVRHQTPDTGQQSCGEIGVLEHCW